MIKKVFNNFKKEVELFFMTKFITGVTLEKTYSRCLDILYNITGNEDSARGILAFNPRYGQGKSFFFDVVNHRHRRIKGRNLFVRTTAKELCEIYTSTEKGSNPESRLIKFISVKQLFIDDIGDELKEGAIRSNYSNKLNVMRFVLLKKYEQWMEKGWITHGTTNLTIDEIALNYDGRVADRVSQMCHWMEFKFLGEGQSFRQTTETRKLTHKEIISNIVKLKKPEVVEEIDLEKYFNELLTEPVSYFSNRGNFFWTFLKDYLVKKEILSSKDFDAIDEKTLDKSEALLITEANAIIKTQYMRTTKTARNKKLNELMIGINGVEKLKVAENIIAKRKFLELKKQKHTFV